ncbi:MAG: MFS transporter [Gammaproteobacteria bacterium]|nr:MFS transporter [Rhodocyclaceae bacterium]MBU3908420.1 MFS transporter [Gammaproteobacteria bacterium]MBU3989358.1 MFS transporter [Gammaproteobacteria bacterium]MBU4005366.1 MFS transporter [Gammaproteobacteria bacterium]MBU4021051.1 MFS transporter [Gammaproteobacteria bacterium]
MYDFANSGYTTVIITALFNAYFVAVVAGNAPWATFAWTTALSVSYALIVLSAPLVGAYADQHAARKKLLAITTVGCVLFTALLWFAQPELLWLAILCVIASNFFFGSGENLIAAFLPELAKTRALGRVSGWGWSLGYLGGLFTLGLCLVYVTWAEAHGHSASEYVPVTMLITAGIFALASLPTFLLLRERGVPHKEMGDRSQFYESQNRGLSPISLPLQAAWREVRQTLLHLRQFRDLARFLLCSLFYQAGIQAVITLAAIYASQAMGFSTRETLLLIFAVNITAAVGAFLFGHVQDRIGHVRTIALTLIGWIATILLLWAAPLLAEGPTLFWVAANLAGLCLGASQSAGRALVGLLAPPSRLAEFYGFWGLSVKLSSIAGPMTYGIATWVSGGDHRSALLLTGSYFVVGLLLLFGVNVLRGRRAALRAARLDAVASRP